MATILAVKGIEHTTPEFQRGVLEMATRLKANSDYLMGVMSFESAGTFDPAIRNPYSGAVGLIQFTKSAAAIVGKSQDELGAMTQVQQLEYVEKYLKPATGRLKTLSDHYMAVFAPIGMGKPQSFALYSAPSKAYEQNAALDKNGDGKITVGEASSHVQSIVHNAAGRIEVPGAPIGATEVGTGIGGLLGFLLFILGIRRFKRNARLKT